LQQIVEKDASDLSVSFNPRAIEIENAAIKTWTDNNGELIKLPPDEQAAMLKEMSGAAVAVSKEKPALADAYKMVTDAAKRAQ
jgi:hypothetical protein